MVTLHASNPSKSRLMPQSPSNASGFLARVMAFAISALGVVVAVPAMAQDTQPAFKVAGKVYTFGDIAKQEQGSFFEIEKKRYELVEGIARDRYLEHFWQQKAKDSGKSVEEAKKAYMEKNAKVSDKEMKETLEKFKDHPQLKKFSKEEQEKQVREYLAEKTKRDIMENIVVEGMKKGDLVISYPKPQEPVFKMVVDAAEPVRYGPKPEDVKPTGCGGEDCPITIVEYSEFQCPFCKRVGPAATQVMSDYKGKVRWIFRDFPLSFHDRAKPASIAARCAGEQGKFWQMYAQLFENQSALSDEDFAKYAGKISGLEKGKWANCVKSPAKHNTAIEASIESGVKVGVSGTPSYFINGRRLSGALPFEEFKRVIDEELGKGKKS